MSLSNIVRQLSIPKRAPVLLQKIWLRLTEKKQTQNQLANMAWLKAHQQDFATVAQQLNGELWQEALTYSEQLSLHADSVLSKLHVTLGGGGGYPLIYFITRYCKPRNVVETGVAAGYSSHAFLSAMLKNRNEGSASGELHSSDFPYFRLENPEKYIGILVPDTLKQYWHLHIDGDAKNLPRILAAVTSVDLFHYDSEKRYVGRQKAMEWLTPKLSEQALVIMDDINDNSFFKELCESSERPFYVFEFQGKHIGLLGQL
jgi:hypothetical protein